LIIITNLIYLGMLRRNGLAEVMEGRCETMRHYFYLRDRVNTSQQEQIDKIKAAILQAIPNGVAYEALVTALEELLEAMRNQSPLLFERRGRKM
jgi:hypothetical protein